MEKIQKEIKEMQNMKEAKMKDLSKLKETYKSQLELH